MNIKNSKYILAILFISLFFTQISFAKSAAALDKDVDIAIKKFEKQVIGGKAFLPKTKAYLVFPSVIRGGIIIGGKYGEGALRVNGETKYYYSMTSASVGFQAGVQEYAMIIAFLSDASLKNFIKSNGWEAGIDGSITISDWGHSKDLSSISFEKPIVGFIYGEKGLMASVSIAGTKFRKIIPQ
ncbi:putative lipoprotein [hydrothermal vent metagenome]|uniref:Putative lipoprotein n=1 Tax=hydrothermal vent metagenome TaxID=652676 RepID=A0A1W1CRK9_9ZZZZ